MRLRLVLIGVGALLLTAPIAVTAAANQVTWHRFNPGTSLATSEHERLRCVQTTPTLVCRYDKVPDAGLSWNPAIGTFRGTDVTASWECPEGFGPAICDHVVAVFEGGTTYVPKPNGAHPVTFAQDHIIVQDGARQVLYQYFIDQFACPWYETFAEALSANPNVSFDCVLP